MSNKNTTDSLLFEGLCYDFCPLEEVNLRVKENMVHILEVTNGGCKLVKCYSRSAADANIALPNLLRPYPVLLTTVHYLMFYVSNRTDVKKWVMYDFLNDRLRAVRQDMTIQRLPPDQCVTLLEPMIRFYVYYGFRLSECHTNEYDPILNKKYLLECLKSFLRCCDIMDRSEEYSQLDNITHRVNHLDFSKQKLAIDRVLVESLYILCNMSDIHPLYRYQQLPESLKSVSALKLAYNISIANYKGNYVRIMKLSRSLCPLTFAALCSYLPLLQKKALKTMSHAYHSKQFGVPVHVLRKWLLFSGDEETVSVCKHYGLDVDNNVVFNKTLFRDIDMPNIKRNFTAKIIQLKLEDVLSYTL